MRFWKAIVAALVLAAPAYAQQQVPSPTNAPASVSAGHVPIWNDATNPQQLSDGGAKGNFTGLTSDNLSTVLLSGNNNCSSATCVDERITESLSPQSSASTDIRQDIVHLTGSSANVANFTGHVINMTVDSSYTGALTAINGFALNAVDLSAYPNFANGYEYRGFQAVGSLNSAGCPTCGKPNDGATTGPHHAYQFQAGGLSGSAGVGGSIFNVGYWAHLSNGNTAGTSNIGLQITGDGDTTDTATNYAMQIQSRALTNIGGPLKVGQFSFSVPAWGASGIQFIVAPGSITDTSTAASGAVGTAYTNKFAANTIAATNANVTYTNDYNLDVDPDVAGTNVTLGHAWAARFGGDVRLATLANFLGSSTGNTNLQASATASGTLTLPSATDTLVGQATTDTLTNKSINGSEVNSGTLLTSVLSGSSVTATGSSSVRSLAARFGEVFNVADYGADPTGVSSSLSGINNAIAALNATAAGKAVLYFPAGNYKCAACAFTAISKPDVTVAGTGPGSSTITVQNNAGAVFSVTSLNRVRISGLSLIYAPGLTLTANPFDVNGGADIAIDHLFLSNAPGIATLGDSSSPSRVSISDISGVNWRTSQGICAIDIERAAVVFITTVQFLGTETGISTSCAIKETAQSLTDTLVIDRTQIYSSGDNPYGVILDGTISQLVNVWIEKSVFDRTSVAGLLIQTTGGANAMRHIKVHASRFDTDSGNSVLVSAGGSGQMNDIDLDDNVFVYRTDAAIKSVQTGSVAPHISITNNEITSGAASPATITSAVAMGTSWFQVKGNRFTESNGPAFSDHCGLTNAVETTADVDHFIIKDNLISCGSVPVKEFSYVSGGLHKAVSDNIQ